MKRIIAWMVTLLALTVLPGASASATGTVKLPASLTELGEAAFQNDTSLDVVEVPEGVTSIGPLTFKGSSLQEIRLPASLTMIDSTAFDSESDVLFIVRNETMYEWALDHGFHTIYRINGLWYIEQDFTVRANSQVIVSSADCAAERNVKVTVEKDAVLVLESSDLDMYGELINDGELILMAQEVDGNGEPLANMEVSNLTVKRTGSYSGDGYLIVFDSDPESHISGIDLSDMVKEKRTDTEFWFTTPGSDEHDVD